MTYTLLIGDRIYSSWSLRGWLAFAAFGVPVEVRLAHMDSPEFHEALADFAPARTVPALRVDGRGVMWDTLAIAETLAERYPDIAFWPGDAEARGLARAMAAEMHSGFAALRGALPMNIRARFKGFKVWSRAQADIDRITAIWRECLDDSGGPFLYGDRPTLADAMYAPVVTRLLSYDVALDPLCAAYCQTVMALPAMQEWVAAALAEPDEIDELEAEF